MSEVRKQPNRKAAPSSTWWHAAVDIESLGPDQRLAHELVIRRRDVTPSVELIMNSALDETGRCVALTSFGTALDSVGDPNRDPRVAVANAASGAPRSR